MSHMHYCDVGGHPYKCRSSECICVCDVPYEIADHSECAIELRACPEHKRGINPVDFEAVREAAAVPIEFPTEMPQNPSRVTDDSKKYAGFCFWCGHGYEKYSRKLEAEHFAHHCPDAPEELRENFRRQFSGTAKGKRQCRQSRTSAK